MRHLDRFTLVIIAAALPACATGLECTAHADCAEGFYCDATLTCTPMPEGREGNGTAGSGGVFVGARGGTVGDTVDLVTSGLGRISGDFGPAMNVDEEITSIDVTEYDGITYVTLWAVRDDGDAMIILNLPGSAQTVFGGMPVGEPVPIGAESGVVFRGCANPRDGQWHFDAAHEELEVQLDPDPVSEGDYQVTLNARLGSGMDQFTGITYGPANASARFVVREM